MDKALYDRGMAMRRKVLGDEYVDRAFANTDDFNRKFQDLLNEFCWGAVWTDDIEKGIVKGANLKNDGPVFQPRI